MRYLNAVAGAGIIAVCITASAGCRSNYPSIRSLQVKHRESKPAGYAIQVGAFSDVDRAVRLAAVLNGKGIDAFYFRNPEGLFAIRFGDFPAESEARREAERLKRERVIESYYVTQPSARGGASHKTVARQQHDSADGDTGAVIAQTAERFVGIPYKWGGNSVVEGLDCSGFTKAVYNLCGISIPRTSREQFSKGEEIGRNELRKGDLIFFGKSPGQISHVGIYIGDDLMVHAPRRGEEIRTESMAAGRYARRFMGARRYA